MVAGKPPPRHWLSWLAFRVYLAILIALCVVAALELVQRNFIAAAAAAVVVTTSVGSPLVAAGAALLTLLLGDYLVAGLAAGAILCHRTALTAAWLTARRAPDAQELAKQLMALPPALVRELQHLAGDEVITTRHMVIAASRGEPARWKPLLSIDPGAGSFDGPTVHYEADGRCSQFASEAAGLAASLARATGRSLDMSLLAAAGAFLPQSAAGAWLSARHPLIAQLRLDPDQLSQIAANFSRTPGGRGLVGRAEVAATLDSTLAARFTRDQLASLSRRRLMVLRAVPVLAGAYAVLCVAAAVPVLMLKALIGFPFKVISRLTRRPRATRRDTAKPVKRAPAPVVRARRPGPLDGWRTWPAPLPALWLLMRPALGIAAIVCAATVEHSDWLTCLAVAVAAALMPLRMRVISLIAAAGAGVLAPFAGAILAVRAVLTEMLLWRLGRKSIAVGEVRLRGLGRVIDARVALAVWAGGSVAASLEQARAAVAGAMAGGDETKIFDSAVAHLLSAWAHARRREAARVALLIAKGTLLGLWSAEAGPATFAELRRLHFIQALVGWTMRWSAVAAAGVVAGLELPSALGVLSSGGAGARLSIAVAVLVLAVPLTAARLSPSSVILGALLCWLFAGSRVPAAAGVSTLAAITVFALRSRVSQLMAVGRARWRDWPAPPGTKRRLRQHWRAAAEAIAAGRIAIGIEMLGQIATYDGVSPTLQSAALGRIALLEVERGNLDAAAQLLEQMPQGDAVAAASGTVAAGVLSAALGDLDGAETQLSGALRDLPERSPLAARAATQLADVLARAERPDEAMAILSRRSTRILAVQGLDSLLDTEVAIAAALAARGELPSARARLKEVLTAFESEGLRETLQGNDIKERVKLAEARGLLLAGDLALQDNDQEDAEPLLARAVDFLGSSTDRALKGAAEVLHGVSLVRLGQHSAGVSKIRAGVQQVEDRRRQLRFAERRTAMILASRRLYDWALGALANAQSAGVREAGLVGATLIESLRRSAVAEGLREDTLLLNPTALALTARIAEGERSGTDVEKLRRELAHEVSSRFARVYLPTPVTDSNLLKLARRHGCLLMFYLPPDAIAGWRAWITADGEAYIEQVVLGADGAALLDTARRENGFAGPLTATPICDAHVLWESLSAALIPARLSALIERASLDSPMRLLVVTDGVLSLVPWAALHIAGRPLVEHAVVQLTPALELAAESTHECHHRTCSVVAHVGKDTGELTALKEQATVKLTATQHEFVTALANTDVGGAYVGAHGSERGLRQQLQFADESILSAASALACSWPSWTVLASCLVGQVSQVAGQEPLGLPVSCILGGADTVIASVVEMTDAGARQVGAATAAALAEGTDPAASLREQQLAFLRSHRLACVADCLGLVCISTLAPEAPAALAAHWDEHRVARETSITSQRSSASGSLPWRFST